MITNQTNQTNQPTQANHPLLILGTAKRVPRPRPNDRSQCHRLFCRHQRLRETWTRWVIQSVGAGGCTNDCPWCNPEPVVVPIEGVTEEVEALKKHQKLELFGIWLLRVSPQRFFKAVQGLRSTFTSWPSQPIQSAEWQQLMVAHCVCFFYRFPEPTEELLGSSRGLSSL